MKYGIPEGFSIDLPQSEISDDSKSVEKGIAKLVERDEWKLLKKHFEGRIEFYQTYLPNGTPISNLPADEVGKRWMVANEVIAELMAVIVTYEEIAKNVKA